MAGRNQAGRRATRCQWASGLLRRWSGQERYAAISHVFVRAWRYAHAAMRTRRRSPISSEMRRPVARTN